MAACMSKQWVLRNVPWVSCLVCLVVVLTVAHAFVVLTAVELYRFSYCVSFEAWNYLVWGSIWVRGFRVHGSPFFAAYCAKSFLYPCLGMKSNCCVIKSIRLNHSVSLSFNSGISSHLTLLLLFLKPFFLHFQSISSFVSSIPCCKCDTIFCVCLRFWESADKDASSPSLDC